MASRGMSTAMLTEIAKQQLRLFHLVEMYFASTGYLTTGHRNLVWNGNTYSALGNLLSFGEIAESADIRAGSINIVLSGVNQANIATALTENFIERRVVIRRGFLNAADHIIVDPVILFDGRIDSWDLNEDVTSGTSTITWKAASHWVDFERAAGRRTNNEDQQVWFPGDKGFEFAAQNDEIRWGKA